jgi:virulence-associated protein VagC
MLAKLTSKNQITLPKDLVRRLPSTEYFDVQLEDDRLILTPVRIQRTDEVRRKLEELGVSENDVGEAVRWARRKR